MAAHARDELGASEATKARPLQVALASAVTFAVGDNSDVALVLANTTPGDVHL